MLRWLACLVGLHSREVELISIRTDRQDHWSDYHRRCTRCGRVVRETSSYEI